MKTRSSFSVLVFFVIIALGLGLAYSLFGLQESTGSLLIGAITFLIAILVSSAIKIADQWEKAVVLRLGRFNSLKGPGLFFNFFFFGC